MSASNGESIQVDTSREECCSGLNSGSPCNCRSLPTDHSRRDFLFKGLFGAAALALPLARATACSSTSESGPALPARKVPVLTPSGKLVELDVAGTNVPSHPHLPPNDPAVRIGVPGRRWVMVIDLAKCDGCKGCTVACNKMHNTPADREWLKV